MIKRALAKNDGTGLVQLDDGSLVAISPSLNCAKTQAIIAKLKSGEVKSEPWSLAAELSLTHPDLSPLDRLQAAKQRALGNVSRLIEECRIDIVGKAGQQSDRDRKADMALNALNQDPSVSAIRTQAIGFLAIPATELGMRPEVLAKTIKDKRDRETAALMAVDAFRIKSADKVRKAINHEAIEEAIAELKQGLTKAITMSK